MSQHLCKKLLFFALVPLWFLSCAGLEGPGAPAGEKFRDRSVNLRATAGDGAVLLVWNTSPGVEAYQVRWTDSSGQSGRSRVEVSGLGRAEFLHSGLKNGRRLDYQVFPEIGGRVGPGSDPASASPFAGGPLRMDPDELERIKSRICRAYQGDVDKYPWGESYVMLALSEFYLASGDRWFLDELAARIEAVLADRDDVGGLVDELRGRVMPGWGSGLYTDGRRHVWAVHTGMLTYPMARFVRLVRQDPNLYSVHGPRADRILAKVIESVSAHDSEWSGEWYVETAGPFKGRPLPHNQAHALGRSIVELWLITRDPKWRLRAEKLAENFQLTRTDRGTFVWPDLRDRPDAPVEDISHGAISVDFACLAARAGIVFIGRDMLTLARTFTQKVYDGDSGFAWKVDGSGRAAEHGLEWTAGRWLDLSAWDPAVFDLGRKHLLEKGLDEICSSIVQAKIMKWKYGDGVRLRSLLKGGSSLENISPIR